MLRLEAVDAYYGDLQALFGVSLEVRDKEIVALVGANAAGKTTTLRVISGLLAPRRGRVLFQGDDLGRLPAHRRVLAARLCNSKTQCPLRRRTIIICALLPQGIE